MNDTSTITGTLVAEPNSWYAGPYGDEGGEERSTVLDILDGRPSRAERPPRSGYENRSAAPPTATASGSGSSS